MQFMRRHTTKRVFWTLISVLLGISPISEGCIRGGALRRRTPSIQPALVHQQYIPNVPEDHRDAAGLKEGRIKAKSERFHELVFNNNVDIVFKDEERRTFRYMGKFFVKSEDHYMSVRCKEKLDFLAMLVKNTWRGGKVKLRVIDAWNQRVTGGQKDSLHLEGRAIDVSTSDRDNRKLGTLGRLAVQAGFDWVHYRSWKFIHVSCKSDKITNHRKAFKCFSGDSSVLLENGSTVPMSDLKIGDSVEVFSPETSKFQFSPILMFLDRLPLAESSDFLRFHVESSAETLTISGGHILYRVISSRNSSAIVRYENLEALQARHVAPGDSVLLADARAARVIARETVHALGAYAPLTAEGTIVVNGVTASCYSEARSVAIAHSVMAPARWTAQLFGARRANAQQGIHWYAKLLLTIAELVEDWSFFKFV